MSKQYEAEKAVHSGYLLSSLLHRRLRSPLLLFNSSYPLLLLKRNCHVKQKRLLSKAVLIERWSVLLEQCFV